MEDAALVRGAVDGQRDAFAAIYARFADQLFAFLVSTLRDRDEAADVLHDTFVTAGARLHQLQDPAKLRPWLYAIARNRALRQAQVRRRVEPTAEVVDVMAPEQPDRAEASELAELFDAVSAGLSPRDRSMLTLQRHGLEGQELAEAMGVKPGHAYVMLSRLRDQIERAMGSLLVARHGSDDCEQLATVLGDWDGRFEPLLRKRVARHIDRCEVCDDTRRRVFSPAALLSVPVFAPAPAAVRQRVLDDVELVSYRGRPWSGPGGFPTAVRRRVDRRIAVAAAAAAALLLAAGTAAMPGGGDQQLVAANPSSTSTTTTSGATTVAPGVGAAEDGPNPSDFEGGAPPVANTPSTRDRDSATDAPPAPNDPIVGPPAGSTSTATGTSISSSSTTSTSTSVTTITAATPPSIGSMTIRPTEIWEAGPSTCDGAARPREAIVSAVVTGERIATVTLEWGGPAPGSALMTDQGGGLHTATLGPFRSVVSSASTTVPVTVRALDARDRQASASGSLILHHCGSATVRTP